MEVLIQSIFQNEIQTKRVSKELNLLMQLPKPFEIKISQAQVGLKIMVSIEHQLSLNKGKPIIVHIILDSKFPFAFPRFYFKSAVLNPLLSDGRDYIEDILQRPWTPSVLLHQIVQLIPQLLLRIEENKTDKAQLLTFGRFHIEQEYGVRDLAELDGMSVFDCKDKRQKQVMLINNTFVLFLDIVEKQTVLLNFEPISHLMSVAKIKQDEMVFTWSDEQQREGRTQTLVVQDSDLCLNTLISIQQSGGALVKKHVSIPEEDVTIKQYQSINIGDIIMNIQIMESELSQQINVNLVNSIMNHYQKAIEYYSAYNDPTFEDLLDRQRQFLSREDVQLVLYSTTEKQEKHIQEEEPQQEQQVQQQGPPHLKQAHEELNNEDIL